MKSLSVNAQEFVPLGMGMGGGGGLMSPVVVSHLPPPPPPPTQPAMHTYHDPSSPIVAFNHMGQPIPPPTQIASILSHGQMNGPTSIQFFNHYELNAKLIDLAASQQQQAMSVPPTSSVRPSQQLQQQQQQTAASTNNLYSYYSEIIPSPIVYTTTPLTTVAQSTTGLIPPPQSAAPPPIVLNPQEWSFIHNHHSSSPIAGPHQFMAVPPPLPPHVLPHAAATASLSMSYQPPLAPPTMQYQQPSLIPHHLHQNPFYPRRKNQNQQQQSATRQQNLNRNNKNTIKNNRIKKLSKQQYQQGKAGFEVIDDENEWPSLENKQQSQQQQRGESETPSVPHTPYIADEAKFRKVVANVQLIKNAAEQHYLMNEEKKLSFKQALSTIKPTVAVTKIAKKTTPTSDPDEKSDQQAQNVAAIAIGKDRKKEREKRRGRRSRSKSKKREQSAASSEAEKDGFKKNQSFDFNRDDFPDLVSGETNDKKGSINDVETPLARPSVTTTIKTSAILSPGESLNKSTSTSSSNNNNNKRLNAPIVLEFANMISALEKSQHHEPTSKYTSATVLAHRQHHHHQQQQSDLLNSSQLQQTSPNSGKIEALARIGNMKMGAQGLKRRGKQSENPKSKKKSTLKKVTLQC